MKTRVLALLLVLVSPALFAAPERVADVLKDMQAHGYTSPTAAMARLQSAQDAQDTHAPLEQRRRYYAALIALALPDPKPRLLQQSLDHLQRLAVQQHCSQCRVSWLIGKAEGETVQDDFKMARAHLQQAAALIPAHADAMQLDLALAQASLGLEQGTLNIAFGAAVKGLTLAEKLDHNADRIQLLLDLTEIEANLGQLQRAASTAQEATMLARTIGFTDALARALFNEGRVYAYLEERSRELHLMQQSLDVSRNTAGLEYAQTYALIGLSDYHLHHGEYDEAIKYGQASARLAQADGDLYAGAVAMANIGLATARLGRTEPALAALQASRDFARRSGNLGAQVIVNHELVKLLQSTGRYKEALQTLQSIGAVNDKITARKRDAAMLELQAKYDDERKNREIGQLSALARLKDVEASAQRWRKSLWTVLATLTVLIATFTVFRLAHARRANRRLQRDVASLTEQSTLDELTGAFNRRHFANMMQPYERDPTARVGLVMVDIDHFKHVNDNLGHEAGDAVLKEVARRLQSLVRERDHVVRWGGEEFVLLLSDASVSGLPLMAKRLLDTVAGNPIEVAGQRIRISVSAGCAVHPLEPGSSWEAALRMADSAMYRAKRLGRNRAACASLSGDTPEQSGTVDHAASMHTGRAEVTDVDGPELSGAAGCELRSHDSATVVDTCQQS